MTATRLPVYQEGHWDLVILPYLRSIAVRPGDKGAVGDGITDDSAAIQAAISDAAVGSGVVFFESVTYKVNSGISVPSNVALIGSLGRATIKAGTAISGFHMVYAIGASSQLTNVHFENLVFDGNNVGGPTFVLTLAGVYDARVINCVFKNGSAVANGNGQVFVSGGSTNFMTAVNSERVLFRDCEITSSLSSGVSLGGANAGTDDVVTLKDVVFDRCYIHDNARSGIENLMAARRAIRSVRVTNSRFERNLIGAHINDGFRNGWVDLEVSDCFFGVGDTTTSNSGGVADHQGRNIRIHDNHFEMGCVSSNYTAFPVALGENNNAKTITAATEAVATATFTTSAAHNLVAGDGVWVRGVTPDGYNGFWTVLAGGLTSTQFTATLPTTGLGAGTVFGTAEPWTQRTRGIWIENNSFYDCAGFDADSSFDVFIRRNRFEKIKDRALHMFGHFQDCFVEDNEFIECGQVVSDANAYNKAALSTGPGVTFRRNKFRDNQLAQTMLYGIYELAGSPFTEQTIAYNDNDFGNIGTPISTSAYLRVVRSKPGHTALTYSATIATNAMLGDQFSLVATNGTAFTISSPTNAFDGMTLSYDIKNSSGGALGAITWGAAFLLAGAFTNPANGKRRTISFYYDGTNWVERNRAAADI